MDTTKIKLNNIDTPYTVDTYQTFNVYNTDSQYIELEYYTTNYIDHEFTDDEYNKVESYLDDYIIDDDLVLKDLSESLVDWLANDLTTKITELNSVIKKVESLSQSQSKCYNYTTDSCILEFTVDSLELDGLVTSIESDSKYKPLKDYTYDICYKHIDDLDNQETLQYKLMYILDMLTNDNLKNDWLYRGYNTVSDYTEYITYPEELYTYLNSLVKAVV
jgi:hypothetical protein